MPLFLARADLEAKIGAVNVRRYADDAGVGSVDSAAQAFLDTVMDEAEGEYFARMMKAYSRDGAVTLAQNDKVLRGHCAWVACELLTERRPEFVGADGWGAYRAQYERAMKHFELVAAAQKRSQGEATAGTNPHVGGNLQPSPPAATEDQFVFAPSKYNPGGSGGF